MRKGPVEPQSFMRERATQHPHFADAVLQDARITAACRGERSEFRSPADAAVQALRLAAVSDAFLAQALYRLKARLQQLGIPVLPRVVHRLAMATGQISIGDPVIVHAGVYLAHGQVVIDGLTEVHTGTVIFPFVTIGLKASSVLGPSIGSGASIGTGAKVLGPIRIGAGARVGANAVVLDDVPDGATAVGVPAKTVEGSHREL